MDFIKINAKRIGYEGVNWIQVAQDESAAGSCEHVNESSGSIKDGEFL
jgi:hypothetical protein